MSYPTALRKIIFPAMELRWPKDERVSAVLSLLDKSQWWEPSKLKQFQESRLQALIRHAYDNVPYYHKIFDNLGLKPGDIQTKDDLRKLPLLTKQLIRNNLNQLTPKNYNMRALIPYSTGGSTGEPLNFFIDRKRQAWSTAAAHRGWAWAGYQLGDKVAYLWASPHELAGLSSLKTRIGNLLERRITLDAFNMTETTLAKYAEELRRFKPKAINAYTSAIWLLAQYLEKMGVRDIKPEAVFTSCEMLFDYQRETISRAFDCEVFDYYSGRDTTLQANECPAHSGYHLSIENAIVEFLREGREAEPGEIGQIVLTDLSNFATPFIRYQIGDLGVPSSDRCACGRTLPLMKKVMGRVTDIITTKYGKLIYGEFFTHLFYGTTGIKQFQFIQKTKEQAALKIVKGEEFSQPELDRIIQEMIHHCDGMRIDTEFVESIPLTASGKYRFVISEVPLQLP